MKEKKGKSIKAKDVTQSWEYQQSLREAKRAGVPTYTFSVGENVQYGAITCTTILESLEGGLLYSIHKRTDTRKRNYDSTVSVTSEESTDIVPWFRLRPLSSKMGQTNLEENEDIRLYYGNVTVESLIHRYVAAGIDMDPEYQRGNVWSEDEKQALLDSIFMHAEIGRFVMRSKEKDSDVNLDEYLYEIVDGKQRLTTIMDFYLNRLAYKGVYYNELSPKDRYCFRNTYLSLADMEDATKEDALRVFLMVNQSGHPMDPTVLNNAKKLLQKEREQK